MNQADKRLPEITPGADQELDGVLSRLTSEDIEMMNKDAAESDAKWSTHVTKLLLRIATKEMERMARRLLGGGQPSELDEFVAVKFLEALWADAEIVPSSGDAAESGSLTL